MSGYLPYPIEKWIFIWDTIYRVSYKLPLILFIFTIFFSKEKKSQSLWILLRVGVVKILFVAEVEKECTDFNEIHMRD